MHGVRREGGTTQCSTSLDCIFMSTVYHTYCWVARSVRDCGESK